jgi:hypothetical protein
MLRWEVNAFGFDFNFAAPLLIVHSKGTQLANYQTQAGKRFLELGLIEILVTLQSFGMPEPLPQEDRLGDVAGKVAP